MSFTFDTDSKERVRTATDIVDLIGSRLELRRQGRNYVALCPWHADSRPSLQINSERQIWKCWVCDIGGDVFNFIMQDEGISFPEALKQLAERAGVPLSAQRSSPKSSQRATDVKQQIYQVLQRAAEFYHRQLFESQGGEAARRYLTERGISDESIEKFQIGLAPEGWSSLLDRGQQLQVTPYTLEQAGMVIRRDRGGFYDRFRNRIMFPIRDREGRPIAFGGRIMPGSDNGAKYINSPETRLFQKSQQLYGFDLAHQAIRQTRQAIVMEGYTDVIMAHQFGLENAVAVLGTALGQPHLKLLRHYCDSVVLLLDGDEAGQRRSDDVLELFLHAQLDVRVLSLPDGADPADFLWQQGVDELRGMISNACDALEFKMRRVSRGFDPLVDTHKANHAIEEMLSLLAKVPHSGLITNDSFRLRQDQLLPRLARNFAIPEVHLRERLAELRGRQSRFPRRDKSQTSAEQPRRLLRPGDLAPFERELLELMIVAPQVAPIALERVQSGWLEGEAARAMFNVYEQLEVQGESLEFDSVLITLEDPNLKSLLVTLYEQAIAKLRCTTDTAENRLRVLTHRMGERQDESRRQQQLNQLQMGASSEEEELNLLQDVIRQARLRQGLEQAAEQPESIDGIEANREAHIDPQVPAPGPPLT